MKRLLLPFLIGSAAAQIPAFPGAEGFGGYSTGGRGGDVYIVTNLSAASVAGSFRYGLDTVPAAGRTIVFAVSGYIPINQLRLAKPKVTIAGQTAPGDGIALRNSGLRISSENVTMRHIRIRHGKNGGGGDCLNLDSGAINVMLDSLSLQFSTDENMSSFGSPPDLMTFQWSANAWGLESHSCGGLWDQNRVSTHHTLWAHHHTRNPKVRTGTLDWTNNITFDWDIGFIMGDSETPAYWRANVRNNYFLCPPGNLRTRALEKALLDRNGVPNFSIYLENNRIDNDGDGLLDGVDNGYGIASGSYTTLPGPLATPGAVPLVIDDPLLAFKKVVSKGGALRLEVDPARPLRDEVDTRLFQNVLNQTRNHVSRESDLAGVSGAGFGTLNSAPAPTDADQDGMPDSWEQALGWNAAVQDHNTAMPNSGGLLTGSHFFPNGTVAGYTRLEEYLHFKSIPHGFIGKNTATDPTSITVDLRKFTAGFVKTPVFTISNVSNGTFAQSLTGGYQVVFTPTQNFSGRAKFDFKVTDADGSEWTQTCALLVSLAGIPRDLSWTGGLSGNAWDETTLNWSKAGTPVSFATGDYASFNDAGDNTPDLSLTGTLAPGSITVNAAQYYTFGGSGQIVTSGGLTKAGAGTLYISNSGANAIAGPILLQEGTLHLSSGGLGNGKITFQGGNLTSTYGPTTNFGLGGGVVVPGGVEATIQMSPRMTITGASGDGTLNLNIPGTVFGYDSLHGGFSGFTGTLNLTGTVANAMLTANFNGGAFDGNLSAAEVKLDNVNLVGRHNSGGNTLQIGALHGTTSSRIGGSSFAGAMTVTTGALNQSTTFAGVIADGGVPTVFTKTGSGTLTLSGANTYTGATTVSGGALHVSGSLGTTPVSLSSGTTLLGAGSFGGTVSTVSGATISPGNNPGQGATVNTGGVALVTPKLAFDLSGTTGGANDKIQITGGGTMALTGVQTYQFNLTDGTLGQGVYSLVETTGTGTASGVSFVSNLPTSGARQTFVFSRNSSGTSPGFVRLTVGGSPAASLVWTGTGPAWDLVSSAAWTGAANPTYFNFDAVTFNDSASNGNVAIAGPGVAPRTLTVSNTNLPYTLSGAAITGATSLVKNGSGTLTLAPSFLSLVTSTTTGSPTLTLTDTAGILTGMNVTGTGIPAATTVTAVSPTTVTISQNASAAGSVALNYFSTNTYSGGTFLNEGILVLATDHANSTAFGSGPVTFGNGSTLTMYNNTSGDNVSPWDMIVPAAVSATFNADSRVALTGRLTGGGNLTMRVPYIRTNITGDWSAFAGTLNVTTDGDGGEFRYGTSYYYPGFPNAVINLPANMAMSFIGIVDGTLGTNIDVGALSGPTSARLRGGPTPGRPFTYRIGGRNTDATFAGIFEEQFAGTITSYIKTGSGTWTLSGSGLWNGGNTIQQGTIAISGNLGCTGSTGVSSGATLALTGGAYTTESVTISPGANLDGHGTLTSDLNCEGTHTGRGFATGSPGNLAISGSAFFGDSAVVKLRVGPISDTVSTGADLALAGTLQVSLAPGSGFGRYPIMNYGGSLNLGTVAITGLPGGLSGQLSTATAGQVVLVIDDSDNDGLPDSWEQTNFGGLAQTAAGDKDNDGTSNIAEHRLGLNPSSGSSAFKAALSGHTITWPSSNGIVFTVKRSGSLTGGSWQTLGTVTGGTGGTASFTDPASFGKAFYTVEFTP